MKLKLKTIVLMLCVPLMWPMTSSAQPSWFGQSQDTSKIVYFKVRTLVETPRNMPPLFGSEPPQSLKGMIRRLKEARLDDSVKAVVVDLEEAALGFGQLQELHDAFQKFAAVDKEVFIHADSMSTGHYALATAASHVSVVPTGDLWLMGMYGETPYLKGLLDKMGLVADFEQCGDYKSAAEILTRTGPTKEAQENIDWLLDSLYGEMVKMIAERRGMMPEERVRELIDNGPYTAEEALKAGLIDSVEYRQDFVADLKERYGESIKFDTKYAEEDMFGDIPDDPFMAMMYVFEKIFNPKGKKYTEPSVAIVYVDGPIMVGTAEPDPLFGGSSGAYSTTIRRALDKARKDDSVKAVVMRVDSPGGSALASEIIWDAARRVSEHKPMIVSMGNVAGSGGYYVACGADMIFADPTTITASIGVVGGKLVTTGGWNKLGINWKAHQRGEMAGMMSTAAPFNEKEREKILHYMYSVYDVFKDHVVKGRGKKLAKPIDELAGGRVFTGAQAVDLGLVDKLGGLDDAIKYAAAEANLAKYEIRVIPEPPTILDMLSLREREEEEFDTKAFSTQMRLADSPLILAVLPTLSTVDPQRVQAIMQALTCVEIVHHEGVATMMPGTLIIR
jgi:protease-4